MKTRALLVLAIMFLGSFFGRFVVLASDINDAINPNASPKAAALRTIESDSCLSGDLAVAVKERIVALDGRDKALANRATELTVYEAQIKKRIGELESANQSLQRNINSRQSARDADIAKLAAIYNGMKPQQAAEIISEMDPKFAAGLLAAMTSEQAAQVVASMDTSKAYLVSVILANRWRQP